MRVISSMLGVGAALLAAPAFAAPKKPAKCSIAVLMEAQGEGTVSGTITKASISARADRPGISMTFAITDASAKPFVFKVWADQMPPVEMGDRVTLAYWCGGFGNHCDARLDDAKGQPLVIAAMNGADKLSAGWTSKPGKILTSTQDVNQKEKSLRRVHALELAHGKTTTAVTGDGCTQITEGGVTWYATGSAISWDGVRPPEGIDYRSYSLIRGSL